LTYRFKFYLLLTLFYVANILSVLRAFFALYGCYIAIIFVSFSLISIEPYVFDN